MVSSRAKHEGQLPADCGLAREHLCAYLIAACQSDPVCLSGACADGLTRPAAASVHAVRAAAPSTSSLMALHQPFCSA